MIKIRKNVSIQSRRRLFFLRPICLFFISFLVVTFATNSYNLYQLNNEESKKNNELNELQEKTEYLKNEIIKLNNPEYIAKYARENYSYSKDGEVVIQIKEDKKEPEHVTMNVTDNKINKKPFIIAGVGLIIIQLFIFLTKKRGNA